MYRLAGLRVRAKEHPRRSLGRSRPLGGQADVLQRRCRWIRQHCFKEGLSEQSSRLAEQCSALQAEPLVAQVIARVNVAEKRVFEVAGDGPWRRDPGVRHAS